MRVAIWIRPAIGLVVALGVVCTGLVGGAYGDPTPRAGRVTTVLHDPLPSAEQSARWIQSFFETDEIWLFLDRKSLGAILNSSRIDQGLRFELQSLFKTHFSAEDLIYLGTNMANPGKGAAAPGGMIRVPAHLRERIPREVLEKVYQHQYYQLKMKPMLSVSGPSPESVLRLLKRYEVSGFSQIELMKSLVRIGDEYSVFLTKHTWGYFPESFRRQVVDYEVDLGKMARQGVRATLHVSKSDDIAAIARKYAGERDPRPIERYIRRLLGNSKNVAVPLENILHPFVRKMIDRYSMCHGPNCFNTGLSVNKSAVKEIGARTSVRMPIEQTTDAGLLKAAYSRYRFVRPDEALRAGDLLIYRDAASEVKHVATYVGDGLVFAKNGMNRFMPYVFQDMRFNEALYFDDGKFRLSVYRVPAAGEKVISSTGKFKGAEVVYRQHSSLGKPKPPIDDFFSTEGQAAFLEDLDDPNQRVKCLRQMISEFLY